MLGVCSPRGAIPMALFFLDYVQETERLALPATDPVSSYSFLCFEARMLTLETGAA